jgi:AraC family transcriptional regulator of adaptative response / DNA-3-methyladenine glycosylase II
MSVDVSRDTGIETGTGTAAHLDHDWCLRAFHSRDPRFDGWFYVGVVTTGIYCRPSCPANPPKPQNVRFHPTAASAQLAGFRACKRCRPDASPGSPEWNTRADVVGRAMRLIADGVVDREGVGGLAARLHYSERHLARLLTAEVGAAPLALARAQRAHTARILIETTELPLTEVAFAAGFSSVRQFNDTVRAVFAMAPRELRRANRRTEPASAGALTLRLPYRGTLDAPALFGFLGTRAVPGVEAWDAATSTYRRTLALPHGTGTATLAPGPGWVSCTLRLDDWRDVAATVQRCRRLLDLDADPQAVASVLAADDALAPLVRARPGLRAPGVVDGNEIAVRAVLGQQVSVAGARTLAARLVRAYGEPLSVPVDGLTHLFPRADVLAEAADEHLSMPGARRASLRAVCAALAAQPIDAATDRAELERRLLAVKGIGSWTAGYVAMRALGDPDVFLPTDLGVQRAACRRGLDATPAALAARAERWRPWRTYAVHHLWADLGTESEQS